MCGLLGVCLREPSERTVPLMTALSIFMDKRGGHSWGFYANDMPITKGLGDLSTGFSALNFRDSTIVMAHCRWATHGSKTVTNSHPFIQGNIIGAHNGVITNHEELNTQYNREFEVDSQHIFQHINDGFDLGELKGYGAITYLDTREPDKVNFCRFNGGQLSVAEVTEPDGKFAGSVWASTEDALEVALAQSGWQYRMLDVKNDQYYRIKEQEVYIVKGKTMPIHSAPKWTGNNTITNYDRTPYGYWAPAEKKGDGNDKKIVDAIFKKLADAATSKSADVTSGKDLDALTREEWVASGRFYHKGRCYACGDISEVVRSNELDERLCLDCHIEWMAANEDRTEASAVLREEFLADIRRRREGEMRREVIQLPDGPAMGALVQAPLALN